MTSPLSKCPTCGTRYWSWQEAFDKFGFDDGEHLLMAEFVADALRDEGYTVVARPRETHNVVITAILRDGINLIPETVKVGYDDPRGYLPDDIVALLDRTFPETEVQS